MNNRLLAAIAATVLGLFATLTMDAASAAPSEWGDFCWDMGSAFCGDQGVVCMYWETEEFSYCECTCMPPV